MLIANNNPLCVTLELPWKDNQRNVSCIPDGTYDLWRHSSPRHGSCLRIVGVMGRSDILIHAGNTIKDTEGCILVGQQFANYGILRSRYALQELLQVMPLGSTKLEIVSV